MIELRWLSPGGEVEPWNPQIRAKSGLRMKLQYRVFETQYVDNGGIGPAREQRWSEWKDVPVVYETEVSDD